ncbi:4Fe-4S single cluster domain-containing protein [Bacillus sp. DTU_2020_1000418_1_SI_GHA_SEK_038]|uniref:4Fe-4S single cluster domain-containing protein n=1 Tax=Bacillus sp. DTU_2020_1000418_1_SI_GHA_SEK_038 TaxID=3077585 RepID=UPI0028E35B0A|nr:4Fe-4S single cluster domain-containing protein [Bacillus sp. DTU_2020_1000418_1_SI_GHA_SEK_038]WNS77418.1 4Fe-4S single cluster domain-containing protein [Bacillus sp. DTU_2020_1000418_1_SI_GHA_SEK_038]
MQIERIFYPLETLGYGKRIGIWLVGCPHRCHLCCNPELQAADPTKNIELSAIFSYIESILKKYKVDGVTISGGDPFAQPKELRQLVKWLQKNSIEDILVYSGYTLAELRAQKNESIDDILFNISVLVDGKYVESLNDNRPLRGSSNQVVHIFNTKYKERYREIIAGESRPIQNIYYEDNLISFGIPPRDFNKSVCEKLSEKGVSTKAPQKND